MAYVLCLGPAHARAMKVYTTYDDAFDGISKQQPGWIIEEDTFCETPTFVVRDEDTGAEEEVKIVRAEEGL